MRTTLALLTIAVAAAGCSARGLFDDARVVGGVSPVTEQTTTTTTTSTTTTDTGTTTTTTGPGGGGCGGCGGTTTTTTDTATETASGGAGGSTTTTTTTTETQPPPCQTCVDHMLALYAASAAGDECQAFAAPVAWCPNEEWRWDQARTVLLNFWQPNCAKLALDPPECPIGAEHCYQESADAEYIEAQSLPTPPTVGAAAFAADALCFPL